VAPPGGSSGEEEIRARAAAGFSSAAAAYDRGRPGYPEAALAWIRSEIGAAAGGRVADLAAGTGKLTRSLAAWSPRLLLALEPLGPMRERLRGIPGLRTAAARAEELPLRDGCLDAILCAQAFHWFDAPRAAAEIARVLRPGGTLVALWNVRDETEPWVAELGRLLAPLQAGFPRHDGGAWRVPFDGSRAFAPLRMRVFPHAEVQEVPAVIDRVASLSYVSSLPEAEREAFLGRVRDLLRTHPGTRGLDRVTFPYRTEIHLAAKAAPQAA
jgi:SAM-dependent methyltransferase